MHYYCKHQEHLAMLEKVRSKGDGILLKGMLKPIRSASLCKTVSIGLRLYVYSYKY